MLNPDILGIIAITDNLHGGVASLVERARAVVRGGATCIQLRLKDVSVRETVEVARALVRDLSVPVVVNDRVDVAIAAGAAGVHLGSDDLPVMAARQIAPPGFIIGASVGNDTEVTLAAGADYAGIGPIFRTLSKADAGMAIGTQEFARLCQRLGIPCVGIGGIDASNAASVIAAGAAGVAALSSLFGASDPEASARSMGRAIES